MGIDELKWCKRQTRLDSGLGECSGEVEGPQGGACELFIVGSLGGVEVENIWLRTTGDYCSDFLTQPELSLPFYAFEAAFALILDCTEFLFAVIEI